MMNKGRFAVLTLKLACMSNRIISVIALLLIKSLICFGQLEDVLPPPEPDGRNVYYLYGDDGWGHVPKGWKSQQKLLKEASDTDLESMALQSKTPAHRAMAFHTLASKHSEKCYDILLQKLEDDDSFMVASFDVWWGTNVAYFMLEVAESDTLLLTKEQRHCIDSVIVFRPRLKHLDKLPSVSRLKGMDGLYNRLKELYLDGDSNLLPFIAEYRNEADIPMIIKALREYKKGLDRHGANSNGPEGNTNEALNALMKWRDDAYMPVLEELRDFELSREYIDYYRVKMLFKVVMAYDNDWAYHFIEDTFENKGGKEQYSYPENLFSAYYEEEKPRFLPLIEKYGKKPFEWDYLYK